MSTNIHYCCLCSEFYARSLARRTVEKYTTLEYVCPNTRANKMLNIQRNNVMYFAHIYIFQYIWYIKLILIKWAIQVCIVSSCMIICYKVIATCLENRPKVLMFRVCLSSKFYGRRNQISGRSTDTIGGQSTKWPPHATGVWLAHVSRIAPLWSLTTYEKQSTNPG